MPEASGRCLVTNTTPLIELTAATGGQDVLRFPFERLVVPLEGAEELLSVNTARALSEAEPEKSSLLDVLARWRVTDGAERQRSRTDQSLCVPLAGIAGNGFDLSINRYKEVVHDAVEHRPPREILERLAELAAEIQAGMKELEGMLP